MTTAVSPTDRTPNFHVTLTDTSGNVVGFILYDQYGNRNERAFRRFPMQQNALKTYQGTNQWSDQVYPYMSIAQDDWSGGRGNEEFDSNKSMFYDSYRANTTRPDGIILGGAEMPIWGFQNENGEWLQKKGNNSWVALDDVTFDAVANQFVASASYSATDFMFVLKRTGDPGTIKVSIYGDSANSPNTEHTWVELTVTDYPEKEPVVIRGTWGTPYAMTGSTKYWFVVQTSTGTHDADNYTEIMCNTVSSRLHKTRLSTTWTAQNNRAPWFHVSAAKTDCYTYFFDYKGALYMLRSPKTGAASTRMFREGYRGVADSNSGNLDGLVNAGASFNETKLNRQWYVYAKIIAGTGSDEQTNWRRCKYESSTVLTCWPPWKITHDTTTEYVIQGTDFVSEITIPTSAYQARVLSTPVVGNGQVFVPSDTSIWRYRAYNNVDTWKETGNFTNFMAIGPRANFLAIQDDPDLGAILWMGDNRDVNNDYQSVVRRSLAPKNWDDRGHYWGGTILANNTAWSESVSTDVTVTFEENTDVKIAWNATFTTGILATEVIEQDMTWANRISFDIVASEDLNAADLSLLIDDTANCVSAILNLPLPELKKDQEKSVVLEFDPADYDDLTTLISIGLQLNADKDKSMYVRLKSPIRWEQDHGDIPVGKEGENITNMIMYDDPENLYVFTEGELGYVIDDKYHPVPLKEMRALKSVYNGRAAVIGGVYLYFGLGPDGRVERYFRQTMDDIGPTHGTGLPEGRRGVVTASAMLPGDRLIIAISEDTGISTTSVIPSKDLQVNTNFSSVLMYANSGWHELYRSPMGAEIDALHLQTIEGQTYQRLWIATGTEVWTMPVSINPEAEDDFLYFPEAHLITSWFYGGMKDISKVFKSVKLFVDKFSGVQTYNSKYGTRVECDYRLESAYSFATTGILYDYRNKFFTGKGWTALPSQFTGATIQEININSPASGPPGLTGRRIQFRFRIMTDYLLATPKILAYVVAAYGKQDVKFGYTWTTKASEGDLSIDLEGDEIKSMGYGTNVEGAVALLDSWANTLAPLKMNTVFSPMDNKTVILDAVPMSPLRTIPDDQLEEHFVNIRVTEI